MSDDKGMDLYEAYAAAPEEFAQLAEVMYGDGAWELVSKLSADEQRRNKRQAQIGLASNVVGIAAGVGGTAAAYQKLKETKRNPLDQMGPVARRIGRFVKTPGGKAKLAIAGAGAAAGLQGLNVAGDAITNRVLARESKKKVSKAKPPKIKLEAGMAPSAGLLKLQQEGKSGLKIAAEYRKKQQRLKKVSKSGSFLPVKETIVWKGEISKRDDDKRQVFGWASVVERNGKPVVDHQDDMIPIDVIEKAAYDYVKSSRKGGDMHRRNGDAPHHVSDMVESFLVTPEKKAALGLPDDFPTGWWVGFQVNDEETWQKVKNGERTEFSIHGSGQRVEKVLED